MQKQMVTPQTRQDAVKRYRRQRTLIKKMIQLAKMRGTKINMIIYDQNLHKVEEIYTHVDASVKSINALIENPREAKGIRNRRRYLKFESNDAKQKYKFDDDASEKDNESDGESICFQEEHDMMQSSFSDKFA